MLIKKPTDICASKCSQIIKYGKIEAGLPCAVEARSRSADPSGGEHILA
jgi:hypothetical protein